MIDLDQVRTFLVIIDAGSFREAAIRLGIAQPTVSQHVKKLEAALGYRLIERNRTHAATTTEGARFLPFARVLLGVADRARNALDRGGLVIGASTNIGVYLLQPLLRAFRSAHQAIAPVDVRIGTNPETAKRLEDAEIDIGLMEWWDDRPGFAADIWRREELVVIVPPGHPWARRKSIHKAALPSEPMVGGESGTGTARLLLHAFGPDAETLRVEYRLGSTEAVKHAVRAGLGVSVTLKSAVRDEVEAGTLRALRVRGIELTKPLFSILSDRTPMDGPARQFSAFLHRRFPAAG